MNCFYHPDTPAVALCKSCGRGLCMECAVDIQNGLACKGRCEERAGRINRMIDNNEKIVVVSNTQLRRNSIFMVAAGVLFTVLGICFGISFSWDSPPIVFVALGVVFILKGIAGYTKGARYPELKK